MPFAFAALATLGLIMAPTPTPVVTRSSDISMMAKKPEPVKAVKGFLSGWFLGDWLTGPGMDKFTDGRRELLAPREFIASKYDPDMNLKKYDSRLNGQTASALKGKKDKSYTTFPFDKIKGKGKK